MKEVEGEEFFWGPFRCSYQLRVLSTCQSNLKNISQRCVKLKYIIHSLDAEKEILKKFLVSLMFGEREDTKSFKRKFKSHYETYTDRKNLKKIITTERQDKKWPQILFK